MLLKQLITCGVLLASLAGCQTVKFDDMFGSTDDAVSAEKESDLQSDQSQKLLSGISAQAELSFSKDDEALAQKALESSFTHQGSSWTVTKGELTVTPTNTFEQEKDQFCREYQAKLTTNTTELSVKSVACRQGSGVWIRQK